jgi:DNA-binding CsgD family transcriptional regulator
MTRAVGDNFSKVLTPANLRKWYLKDGLSQVVIAEKLGCSKHLVSFYMRRYKIPRRKVRDYVILGIRRSPVRKYQRIKEV